MRRLATVRVRITVAAVLVVGASLVAGAFWLVRAHRDGLTTNLETTARLRSQDVAASVGDGNFSPRFAVPRGDENLVQVVDEHGVVVAESANIVGDARISHLRPDADGYSVRTVAGLEDEGPYRVVARRVHAASGTYVVYVARSLEGVTRSTDNLERLLWWSLPALLTLMGVLTWVVTGRALRPVEAMRREVEVIGGEDLHRRVPEPVTEDEIGRLARTMNAMLTRLEDATDRQRRFVADASHELRSPLTGIRAQLEVDLEHPELADWQATERDVLADAIRMQRLVDDLLVIAVADASALDAAHRAPVDLDEIVLAEARRLDTNTALTVDTRAVSGAQVDGNADQLLRVVRNLLDNAGRHARSQVELSLTESNTDVTLRVVDDGPGIPDADRERVFERFARVDDARGRDDDGGAGLGLAIVHDVVVAHGGSVAVENTPGAAFTVVLPLHAGL
ncbi:MAG TPA: HAMP domain-containing sensor histidine kinase [Acidimicrobiia bacterium]